MTPQSESFEKAARVALILAERLGDGWAAKVVPNAPHQPYAVSTDRRWRVRDLSTPCTEWYWATVTGHGHEWSGTGDTPQAAISRAQILAMEHIEQIAAMALLQVTFSKAETSK